MANAPGAPPVTLPYATSVVATVTGAANYFACLLTGSISGTFSFSTADTQNAMEAWVAFTQDGSGSHTVTYATNIKMNSLAVSSTASSTTIFHFFFDTASQFWYAMSYSKTG
jgi:hypothetical protein